MWNIGWPKSLGFMFIDQTMGTQKVLELGEIILGYLAMYNSMYSKSKSKQNIFITQENMWFETSNLFSKIEIKSQVIS